LTCCKSVKHDAFGCVRCGAQHQVIAAARAANQSLPAAAPGKQRVLSVIVVGQAG
jgi:hypothetical protein